MGVDSGLAFVYFHATTITRNEKSVKGLEKLAPATTFPAPPMPYQLSGRVSSEGRVRKF